MPAINTIFDYDLCGLRNLFKGVVAYVEIKSDLNDFVNQVNCELREMGGIISKRRNYKVTHIIFQEGTLQTSNWAKKYDIPLVGVGWIFESVKHNMRFLYTPWKIDYLIENFDVNPLKEKKKNNKYCKTMKIIENKESIDEMVHQMKESFMNSSSVLSSRIPVINLSNNFLQSHSTLKSSNKRQQIQSRYSWESSDEDILECNNSVGNEKIYNNKENSQIHNEDSLRENGISPFVIERSQEHSTRRLFNSESLNSNNSLITPISKCISKNRSTKRKSEEDIDPVPKMKRKGTSAVSFLFDEHIVNSNALKDSLENMTFDDTFLLSLHKDTCCSTSKDPSLTPIENGRFRRAEPLLKSFRKYHAQSASFNDSCVILVPETEIVNKSKRLSGFPKHSTPSNIFSVQDTPFSSKLLPSNNEYDSFSSSVIRTIFDSPNVSNVLNEIIPERVKCDSLQHILFRPKNVYNHCSRALTPDFSKQFNYFNDIFPKPTMNKMIEFLNNKSSDTNKVHRSSTRPSNAQKFTKKGSAITDKSEKLTSLRRSTRLSQSILTANNTQEINHHESVSLMDENTQLSSQPKVSLRRSIRISQCTNKSESAEMKFQDTKCLSQKTQISNYAAIDKSMKLSNNRRKGDIITSTSKDFGKNHIPEQFKRSRGAQKRVLLPSKGIDDIDHETQIKAKPLIRSIISKTRSNMQKHPPTTTPREATDEIITELTGNRNLTSNHVSGDVSNEFVFLGFNPRELKIVEKCFATLPRKYCYTRMIKSKEQLVVVSKKPTSTLDLMKAFILGNTFVSFKWLEECFSATKWISWSSFIITFSNIIKSPSLKAKSPLFTQLFQEYCPMYISTNKQSSVQKYKLKKIIEFHGGTVTDSIRQAGIVLDTRKVNALSLTSLWVLECIWEDRILDHLKYSME